MIYLGIDPGAHAGLALIGGPIRTEPRRLESETLHMPKAARDGLDLSAYIKALHRLPRPDHAAIEHPFPVYVDGKIRNLKGYETQILAVFMFRLAVFEVWGIVAETPYPSEWQVVFRGAMGDGTKAKAITFARAKFAITPETDHEADALGLAYWLSTRYSWVMDIDDDDPRAGTMRALNEHMRRHGGHPMLAPRRTK